VKPNVSKNCSDNLSNNAAECSFINCSRQTFFQKINDKRLSPNGSVKKTFFGYLVH
jgi:hypothetical protein